MIPIQDCPKHGKQPVYAVCHHLFGEVKGVPARNSTEIAVIIPPREGWVGFVMCGGEHSEAEAGKALKLCEKCCLEQELFRQDQVGRAWFLQKAKP